MATAQQTPGRSGEGDSFLWPGIAIFSLALAVRALHLWQIRGAVFFELKMGDARTFDVWARQIAAGDWLGDAVFYQAPLYPYFLGSVYALLSDDPTVLDTLAAAYAAAGRFDEAIATAERALVAARRDGDHHFVAEIRERLELYREDQPYRRPSLAQGAEAST